MCDTLSIPAILARSERNLAHTMRSNAAFFRLSGNNTMARKLELNAMVLEMSAARYEDAT